MTKQTLSHRFAICIVSDDPDLLTPRSVYEVWPDHAAAKSNFIRVVDNEGEDYLYPAKYFVFVDFPQAVERTLRRVPHSPAARVSTRQKSATPRTKKTAPRAG